MSVDTNTNIGWFAVLRQDLRSDACYDMDDEWADFIVGTDPMCGLTDYICVFNRTRDSNHYDVDAVDGLVEFDSILPRPLSESAVKFVEAFKQAYGEDSIRLAYGALRWYS